MRNSKLTGASKQILSLNSIVKSRIVRRERYGIFWVAFDTMLGSWLCSPVYIILICKSLHSAWSKLGCQIDKNRAEGARNGHSYNVTKFIDTWWRSTYLYVSTHSWFTISEKVLILLFSVAPQDSSESHSRAIQHNGNKQVKTIHYYSY